MDFNEIFNKIYNAFTALKFIFSVISEPTVCLMTKCFTAKRYNSIRNNKLSKFVQKMRV